MNYLNDMACVDSSIEISLIVCNKLQAKRYNSLEIANKMMVTYLNLTKEVSGMVSNVLILFSLVFISKIKSDIYYILLSTYKLSKLEGIAFYGQENDDPIIFIFFGTNKSSI